MSANQGYPALDFLPRARPNYLGIEWPEHPYNMTLPAPHREITMGEFNRRQFASNSLQYAASIYDQGYLTDEERQSGHPLWRLHYLFWTDFALVCAELGCFRKDVPSGGVWEPDAPNGSPSSVGHWLRFFVLGCNHARRRGLTAAEWAAHPELEQGGRCIHTTICPACGQVEQVDSSD